MTSPIKGWAKPPSKPPLPHPKTKTPSGDLKVAEKGERFDWTLPPALSVDTVTAAVSGPTIPQSMPVPPVASLCNTHQLWPTASALSFVGFEDFPTLLRERKLAHERERRAWQTAYDNERRVWQARLQDAFNVYAEKQAELQAALSSIQTLFACLEHANGQVSTLSKALEREQKRQQRQYSDEPNTPGG